MIVTDRPPFLPFLDERFSRLPGVVPIDEQDWIIAPDDLNEQLAYRDFLVKERAVDVLGLKPEGLEPSLELLDALLDNLIGHNEWTIKPTEVIRPDGQPVAIDRSEPLVTIGRLVSEDFCILARPDDAAEYALVAAVVCFPSGWSLSEKMGKSMSGIHVPVPYYNGDLAKRVNRIFDGMKPGRLLLRFNWSLPVIHELHSTPSMVASIKPAEENSPHFLRVERQTFRRLPKSNAVAFGIRTTLTPISSLQPDEAKVLLSLVKQQSDDMVDYKDGGSAHQNQLCAKLLELSER